VLAVIPVLSVVVLVFLAEKITESSNRITRARSDEAAFAKRYESFDRLKSEWTLIEPHLAQLERAIPSPDSFPQIKSYIESSVAKTVNLSSTRFDNPVPKLGVLSLRELSFTMDVTGTFTSIQNKHQKTQVTLT